MMILNILNNTPKHAYAIMSDLEDLIGFKPPTSIVYPLLRSLHKRGLVDYREESRSGRKIKIYYLTDKGRNYLEENKERLDKALSHANKHRLMRSIGVDRIFMILRELHDNIDKLSEDQLRNMRRAVLSFEKEIREILINRGE